MKVLHRLRRQPIPPSAAAGPPPFPQQATPLPAPLSVDGAVTARLEQVLAAVSSLPGHPTAPAPPWLGALRSGTMRTLHQEHREELLAYLSLRDAGSLLDDAACADVVDQLELARLLQSTGARAFPCTRGASAADTRRTLIAALAVIEADTGRQETGSAP
ncbi:hypothetical protein ACIRO1_35200 [Streptomyces sp. NPDC102381]|uniref:hypothetical protein n=1 Tax=Streptomyces sp. NPDC102381 TaxID=3366164 RepID=UPI003825283C